MAKNKPSKIESSFDWTYFVRLCMKHWVWFVASVMVCCGLGVVKYKLTAPAAKVCAKIMVAEDSSRGSGGIASLMTKQLDLGSVLGGTGSVYNEMQVMGSHTVFENTVKELELNCHYSVKRKLLKPWEEPWEKTPIRLDYDKGICDTLSVGLAFAVSVKDNGTVSYKVKEDKHTLAKASNKTLPCVIPTPYGEYTLSPTDYFQKGKSFDEKILLLGYSPAAENLEKAVRINVMSKKVDVVEYSFITSNPEFGKKILTSLIQQYNDAGIKQKQEKGELSGQFIEKRLADISENLKMQEAGIEKYKVDRGLSIVKQDAKLAYTQAKTLRNQLIAEEAEIEILRLIRSFVDEPGNEYSLVPAVIEEKGAAADAISLYNETILERMRLLTNARQDNASIKLINDQLAAMRNNIKLTIDRTRETAEARAAELRKEVVKAEAKLYEVPATEREYVVLERNRAVQEKLYLYLLQQREENAMRSEASLPRGVTVDAAYVSGEPIGMTAKKALMVSFLLGLCLPAGFLFVKERLRSKVATAKEITSVVPAPVLAEMPMAVTPGDASVEQLRTNVKCLLSASAGKLAAVTSSTYGEGKTAVALSLAESLVAQGAKVLLAELDFVKPSLAAKLGMNAPIGLVQYLSGDVSDESKILTRLRSGLDVMVAGLAAPNPVDILASAKLKSLIEALEKEYDYIIVDFVTLQRLPATFNFASLVPVSVIVCGIGVMPVDSASDLSTMLTDGKLSHAGIVITSHR